MIEKTYCSDFDYQHQGQAVHNILYLDSRESVPSSDPTSTASTCAHTETHSQIRLLILWEKKHAEISSTLDKNLILAALALFLY